MSSQKLDKLEREGVEVFLQSIRRRYERSVPLSQRYGDGRGVQRREDQSLEKEVNHIRPGFWHQPGDEATSSKKSALTWLCLPFFVLGPYDERKHSNSGLPPYPELTLLESKYGSRQTSVAREQEQAASLLLGRDLCFIVSQLWCLMVSNST